MTSKLPNLRDAGRSVHGVALALRSTDRSLGKSGFSSRKPSLLQRAHHFHDRITQASSAKELHSVLSNLLGSSTSSPLPTTYPPDDLPERFSQYFKDKIKNLAALLITMPLPHLHRLLHSLVLLLHAFSQSPSPLSRASSKNTQSRPASSIPCLASFLPGA